MNKLFLPHILIAGLLIASAAAAEPAQPRLGARSKPVLAVDGLRFRDLNASGALDPYEDWRLSPERRAQDLVSRMTLEEKAGALMHGTAPSPFGPAAADRPWGYDLDRARTAITGQHVSHMITRLAGDPAELAEQNNALQQIAEETRLGVPLTVSTDPRNHFQFTAGAAVDVGGFSQWPEMLGMAAVGDAALVRRFGDIARQEYRAVGIHMGLSPQADLATEPRWTRVTATFGEDPALAGRMARAYVEGFQGGADGVRRDGVALVIKHFAGYGAQVDGFDAHNFYGRFAHFPGGAFDAHVEPFRGAIAAKVAGMMPTYAIFRGLKVDGTQVEQVGGGFNRWLLTDILRRREGFGGFVLSDWLITADCDEVCVNGSPPGQPPRWEGISTGWGVQDLPKTARFAKGLEAGLDQFGGVEETEEVARAVRQGLVSEARVTESARRVMALKFAQGLFEDPYVDPAAAGRIVGAPAFRAEGEAAQRRALVLLENKGALLPLKPAGRKVWLSGVAPEAAQAAGFTVVDSLDEADLAIVRASAPYQVLHPGYPFGAIQHEGDLDFKEGDKTLQTIRTTSAKVPTIVTVMLDRPAILTNVKPHAAAMFGDFGISDAALLDVIAGRAKPEGKLPFELPSSMAAVRAQKSDLPYDSKDPLYRFGYGLRY